MRNKFSNILLPIIVLASLVLLQIPNDQASAAGLQLTWADNSSDETGFKIERRLSAGTFGIVASVAANVTSYSDSGLIDNTTYCYRVNAFNGAGSSPYTPEVCGTTPAPTPTVYSLTLLKQGSGTITSNPAAINCGATCAAGFTSGVNVTLQAAAATGYTFTGWSGDADCSDGSVTMSGNRSCTATFTANPVVPTSYTLTVSTVGTITAAGSGSGKIVSSPTGIIDCGTKCSATFSSGSIITLQAIPTAGSTFTGWSGAGCTTGVVTTVVVTMNASKTCAATFSPQPSQTFTLSVAKSGTGTGTVTSSPAGINCGNTCSGTYDSKTLVTLTVTPAAGSTFAEWSGSNCTSSTLTMNANTTCTAVFTRQIVSNVGLYRPSTGAWYLIANATGSWQDCNVDQCIGPFGAETDMPLIGDWNGSGKLKLGVYDTSHKNWELDVNDSSSWQGCRQDRCLSFAVNPTSAEPEIPLVGSWDGAMKSGVGVYRLVANPTTTKDKPRTGNKSTNTPAGYWYFDRNGNGKWDGCSTDLCFGPFGAPGDIAVVGNWNATSVSNVSKIGVFTPQTGMWKLDINGNGIFDGCTLDSSNECFGPFGTTGDIPIVGDWSGTGTAKIGVFTPQTGMWKLDINGNGKFDGCTLDKCLTDFGQTGDLPVVGKW